MKAPILAITVAALILSTAYAGDLITKNSPYSVSETVDRLQSAVEEPVPKSLHESTMPRAPLRWVPSCGRPRC